MKISEKSLERERFERKNDKADATLAQTVCTILQNQKMTHVEMGNREELTN